MRIVLMGPPGAGKGTQAKRLVEKYGMTHLSSGDIFRAEKSSGSELGLKIAAIIDKGQLLPDDMAVDMMARAIIAVEGGLLLDGFPRTVAQAKALDENLENKHTPLDAVVLITADDEAIVERICGRRTCKSTGKIYHIKYMPPKVEGIDDETGEPLVQRADDKEDVVRKRLETYKMQTEPVVAYYRERGTTRVIEVDGMKSPDEVANAMADALGDLC